MKKYTKFYFACLDVIVIVVITVVLGFIIKF
jgi:hypothetical protein